MIIIVGCQSLPQTEVIEVTDSIDKESVEEALEKRPIRKYIPRIPKKFFLESEEEDIIAIAKVLNYYYSLVDAWERWGLTIERLVE